jgi:hypothetical protein
MDRIHELMSSEEATTDDARAQIRSYVRFLFGEEGGPIRDPESALKRFEHWYPKVTASVLAAVQQRAADAGDAAVGGAADADAGRKKVGMQEVKVDEIDPATGKKTGKKVTVIDPLTGKPKLEQANWCGAFAALLSERAGANPANSHLLNHESPLRSTFSYGVSQKIEVDGQVLDVKAYHSARGSMRSVVKFPDVIKDPESIDLQPGDIVLLDNARGLDPDHIQTCVFYNNHTGMLTTVGGNEGSGKAEVTVVNKGSRDLREQQAPNDVTKTDGPKHVRVWGRARWSIVDFEPHVYPKA